jgi:hypothetical protein
MGEYGKNWQMAVLFTGYDKYLIINWLALSIELELQLKNGTILAVVRVGGCGLW